MWRPDLESTAEDMLLLLAKFIFWEKPVDTTLCLLCKNRTMHHARHTTTCYTVVYSQAHKRPSQDLGWLLMIRKRYTVLEVTYRKKSTPCWD